MFGYPILDSISFSTLGDDGKGMVRDLFDKVYKDNGKLHLDTNMLFTSRKRIPICFEFYKKKLDQTNPALFQFLNDDQKESLRQDLLYSFYIFSAQYQLAAELSLDASESRRSNLQECGDKIKRCAQLLDQLQAADGHAITDNASHYLTYLGLESVEGLGINNHTATKEWSGEGFNVHVKDLRNGINSPRLYWVWASSWIQSWIDLLPVNFFNKEQARYAVLMVSPIAGFLSFSLYLTNALVELIMLAKHTIRSNWWSTAGEKQLNLSAWQRFCAHVDLRKYSILNDGIWGLGNLACYFWLTGVGSLGFYGNVATTALLLMDVVLSGLRYYEEFKQHRHNSQRFNRDISDIRTQIAAAVDQSQKALLWLQLQTLTDAEKQDQFEWKYKSYGLVKDLIYAVVLIVAFAMVCSFFLPVTIVTPTIVAGVSVGGAALCYLSSIVNDAVGGIFDINKSYELRQQADTKRINFSNHLLQADESSLLVKKQYYLDIKQWEGEAYDHGRVAHYQIKKLVCDLLLKLLLPPVMLATFVFLPVGMAVVLFAIGFFVALASIQFFVGDQPEPSKLPSFDLDDYELWAKASPTLTSARNQACFFAEKKPDSPLPQDGFFVNAI